MQSPCIQLLLFAGLSKAEIQAAVLESERRLAEKHARLEGAVVQVWVIFKSKQVSGHQPHAADDWNAAVCMHIYLYSLCKLMHASENLD